MYTDVKDKLPPACTEVLARVIFVGSKRVRYKYQVMYISTRPRECVEDDMITHWMHVPLVEEKS